MRDEGRARAEEEMGDLLFSIANLARKLGIEPESALRKANEKFSARFERWSSGSRSKGRSVHDATLEEMEEVWQQIKRRWLETVHDGRRRFALHEGTTTVHDTDSAHALRRRHDGTTARRYSTCI